MRRVCQMVFLMLAVLGNGAGVVQASDIGGIIVDEAGKPVVDARVVVVDAEMMEPFQRKGNGK